MLLHSMTPCLLIISPHLLHIQTPLLTTSQCLLQYFIPPLFYISSLNIPTHLYLFSQHHHIFYSILHRQYTPLLSTSPPLILHCISSTFLHLLCRIQHCPSPPSPQKLASLLSILPPPSTPSQLYLYTSTSVFLFYILVLNIHFNLRSCAYTVS
jgi:hypothetical protein